MMLISLFFFQGKNPKDSIIDRIALEYPCPGHHIRDTILAGRQVLEMSFAENLL